MKIKSLLSVKISKKLLQKVDYLLILVAARTSAGRGRAPEDQNESLALRIL